MNHYSYTIHRRDGEFQVRFYMNGERLRDADYYTDSRKDAVGTGNAELARMRTLDLGLDIGGGGGSNGEGEGQI
jgi:hypothetical protein